MKNNYTQEKTDLLKELAERNKNQVPVLAGCKSAEWGGGCFCTGACKVVVGWRDKFPGEDDLKIEIL